MLSLPEQIVVKLFSEILEKNTYNFNCKKCCEQLEEYFKKIEIKDVSLDNLYKYRNIYEYILDIHEDKEKIEHFRKKIRNTKDQIKKSKIINTRIFRIELIIFCVFIFIGFFFLFWGFLFWMFLIFSAIFSIWFRLDNENEWKTFWPSMIFNIFFLVITFTFFTLSTKEWIIYWFISFIISQFLGNFVDSFIREKVNYIPDHILYNYSFEWFYSYKSEPYIRFFRSMILKDAHEIELVISFLNESIENQLTIQSKRHEELKLAAINREKIENIKKMDPYDFEFFIAQIFEYYWFKSKTTKKSWDDGIDIMLWRWVELMAVQCKRQKWNVWTPSIRNFIGSMQFANIKKWFFVTTGNFSLETMKMLRHANYELFLIDIGTIERLIAHKNKWWEIDKFNSIIEEWFSDIKDYTQVNRDSREEGKQKYKYLRKYNKYKKGI